MTRKDYEAIAGALFQARLNIGIAPDVDGAMLRYQGVDEAIASITDVLAADNARFDRQRFVRACITGNMGRGRS